MEKARFILSAAILFLLVQGTAVTFAASLTISPAGNGVFTLQGVGLADVAGIDATIGYDSATLRNPSVTQGGLASGAFFQSNAGTQGSIRIALIATPRGISGSGVLATIRFDVTGADARVLFLNANKVINSSGTPISVQTEVRNPAPSGGSQEGGQSGGSLSATDSGLSGSRYLGPTGVSLPSETVDQPPRKEVEGEAQPSPATLPGQWETVTAPAQTPAETGREEKAGPAASPPVKMSDAYRSVLEGFRLFTGDRTPQSMKELFNVETGSGIVQEPAIALSDGRTGVILSIRLSSAGQAPNFAPKGAEIISLRVEGDAWLVEALPVKNAHAASVTVLNNGRTSEIPLTVAPAATAEAKKLIALGDPGFALFLKERGTEKAPRYDLNGDGRRDYIDDYIFTANYLVYFSVSRVTRSASHSSMIEAAPASKGMTE